ncbi:sodium-coupled monocarboxylate transporter 1-like, partial [Homarus americanus]|uniref:sodium-coupled monocarboxylate transporter 1-like n=1 Tax=Homarus americanus TaxID=6706 RepID=UPI001C43E8D1
VVAGVIAVGLGLLVEKLGSIYNVSNSILSAVAGPFAGIFFTGICAPWVNAKGSMVGFLLAFFFNVWVVVGKFVRGGGKVPRLPLSTKGCPGNLANATLCSLLTNTTEVLPFNTPVTDAVLFNTTEINVGLCNTTLADAVMSNTTMTALLSNSTIVQESVPTNHLTLFFCPANITLITTRSGEQQLRDTLVFLLSR